MTAMDSIADAAIAQATAMPRFDDGLVNLQEVLKQLAESAANEITGAEADQPCEATHNSRNGYRERKLVTCAGTPAPGMPNSLESCCRDAARIPGEAEPDALACPGFPATHRRRLRANNVQERTNRGTRRRSRVARVFPSVASLERLAGAVMCDRDEAWSDARHFSEERMAEPCDDRGRAPEEPPTPEQLARWHTIGRSAIEASLGLADEPGAA